MEYRRYIWCLLFIAFSCTIYGQENEQNKSSKFKRDRGPTLLEQASKVKDRSPTKAVKLVEQAVLQAAKQKDWQTEGEAYVLLANIYEDIDQKALAIQRYEQALNVLGNSKNLSQTASIHQRMGQLFLNLNDDLRAESSFRLCLEYGIENDLRLKCEEGLADVELLRGNVTGSITQLDFVSENYQLDSISNARVEARRSQAYVQQNDYSKASESFYNSVNTLPKNQKLDREDYAPIEKAQEELLNFKDIDNADKLAVQNSVISNAIPDDVFLKENLKIAELYEAENNLPEAEKFIAASKNAILENSDAETVANVYKKSSEINQKKGRFGAALDDLEKYISAKERAIQKLEGDLKQQVDIVKGQKELDERKQLFYLEEKERELFQSQLKAQKIIIGFLCLMLLASVIYFYFLFKNIKSKRRANQMLLLKSLRTQMNPHFIFNALNSVNNFIAKNDEKAANKFLSEFSRLMRKVLDYSQNDFIPFSEEIELNELYLKLEHFRFRDKFDYRFQNEVQLHGYDLEVPPMLIQPFIENAVWHGLRYKENRGQLDVLVREDGNNIIITIQDNGIGREKSKALKTENQKTYKSTGLDNVSKRVALVNEIYHKNYEINVRDLNSQAEDAGTFVQIKIPIS